MGSDSVLMFGSNLAYNNTYLYDLSENTWTVRHVIVYTAPPSRTYFAMAPIYGTDCVVLFGGGRWYDDTWIYKHFLISENGTYVSKPFDTGSNSSFKKINWFANTPAKTSLKFQLRTADNESNLATQAFIGPDGSNATYYTTSGAAIWSGHHGERWIQYKAYLNISLNINYDYPVQLKEVTISYNCLPETIVDAPTNGSISTKNKPKFIWTFDDHDSVPAQRCWTASVPAGHPNPEIGEPSHFQRACRQVIGRAQGIGRIGILMCPFARAHRRLTDGSPEFA